MPHFMITCDYTSAAFNKMMDNPNTNRFEAVNKMAAAAGAKVVCMFAKGDTDIRHTSARSARHLRAKRRINADLPHTRTSSVALLESCPRDVPKSFSSVARTD